jgi:hypothetical protein
MLPNHRNETDRKDQELRRNMNDSTTYIDNALCDWCGDRLNGYTFECSVCKALLCPQHSCVDGRCPEHTNPGENIAFER